MPTMKPLSLWMMTNKKYFAFSYGDEQEKAILISFNFWWQQNCIYDKGWLVWSRQELSWHYYRQEIFFFSYGDEQEKLTLFGKREIVWQKRHCSANIDCLIKFQKRLRKSKSKYQTIFKKKVKHHLIVWGILILGRALPSTWYLSELIGPWLQGSANRRIPGCESFSGNARQKW